MTTHIQETIRLDVRRWTVGHIVSTIIGLLDRQQRGWRVAEITVTIERPVRVTQGAATPRLRTRPEEPTDEQGTG